MIKKAQVELIIVLYLTRFLAQLMLRLLGKRDVEKVEAKLVQKENLKVEETVSIQKKQAEEEVKK